MAKQNMNQKTVEGNESHNKYESFFNKNKKLIGIVLAAILLIIAGVILYNNYVVKPRVEKADTMLAKTIQLFEQEQYEQALNGNGPDLLGFVQIANDFSSTPAGNNANYFAGICYAKLEKWQEAINYLEKFDTKKDLFVSPMSQMALGHCYANVKQFDKAVDAFKKAASMADKAAADGKNNTVSPTALKEAAIILLDQKKNSEALELFQEIKNKYVNSPVYMEIDKYIELANK